MILNETWYPEHPTGINTVPFMDKVLRIISTYSISSFFESEPILAVVKKDGLQEFRSEKSVLKFETKRSTPQQFIIHFESPEFDFRYTYELSAQFTNGAHTLYVKEQGGDSAAMTLKQLVEDSIQESLEHLRKKGAIQAKVVDGKLVMPKKKTENPKENGHTKYIVEETGCEVNQFVNAGSISLTGEIKNNHLQFSMNKDGISWKETIGTQNAGSVHGGHKGEISLKDFIEGTLQSLVRRYFGEAKLRELLNKAMTLIKTHSPQKEEYLNRSSGETFLRFQRVVKEAKFDLIVDLVEIRYGVTTSIKEIPSAQGGDSGTVTHLEFLSGKGQDFIRDNFGAKVLEEILEFVRKFTPHPN